MQINGQLAEMTISAIFERNYMSKPKVNVTIGPLPMILFVVFLVLKLTGHIDWSWWYVSMPLWLVPAVLLGVVGIAFLIGVILKLVGK